MSDACELYFKLKTKHKTQNTVPYTQIPTWVVLYTLVLNLHSFRKSKKTRLLTFIIVLIIFV